MYNLLIYMLYGISVYLLHCITMGYLFKQIKFVLLTTILYGINLNVFELCERNRTPGVMYWKGYWGGHRLKFYGSLNTLKSSVLLKVS